MPEDRHRNRLVPTRRRLLQVAGAGLGRRTDRSRRTALYFRAFIAFVRHKGLHMSALPPCPKCKSEFTYQDGGVYICPECAHEWSAQAAVPAETVDKVYRDSAGNV